MSALAPTTPYDYDRWSKVVPMDRIPFLVELRNMILEQSNTRMPKWRVKYTPDLAAVIQPRPEYAVMRGKPVFLWIAAQGEHPVREWFEKPAFRPAGVVMMSGAIRLRDAAWSFRPRRFWRRKSTGLDREAALAFRDRVFVAFQTTHLGGESSTTLLSAHCLICGRHLTDPISEVRMIGPECAGRHPALPVIKVPITGPVEEVTHG